MDTLLLQVAHRRIKGKGREEKVREGKAKERGVREAKGEKKEDG